MISIDLGGMKRLGADLSAAGGRAEVQGRVTVRRTAYDVESTAKMLAPVLTGELRDSITTTIDGMSAEVGPTVDYGRFVEEGTSTMAPEPYMGPALDRHADDLVKGFEKIGDSVL